MAHTMPYTVRYVPYEDVVTAFAGCKPSLPVFQEVDSTTVHLYLPRWALSCHTWRVQQLCAELASHWPAHTLEVVLVSDVPTRRLFGDWVMHRPSDPETT